MEQRNKLIMTLLIAAVIVVAVLSSFGLGLFGLNTPEVKLPDASPTESGTGTGLGNAALVEVTPETVQSVLKTLSRPGSYTRTVTIETFSDTASNTETARVWVDDGWTRVDLTYDGGWVQHSIVGDGVRYLWYNGGKHYVSFPADSKEADLAQQIPTYEDVLELDQSLISDTGYQDREGLACVYVTVTVPELSGYLETYWVSVSSGLLVSSETYKDGTLAYRMSAYTMESPVTRADFSLPDGTVLHTVS
ncbi:MAG: hypothetical protein LKK00_07880 [Intestinimonas sp.]|nr:hypothetical protein [Intestinimonas sp.]